MIKVPSLARIAALLVAAAIGFAAASVAVRLNSKGSASDPGWVSEVAAPDGPTRSDGDWARLTSGGREQTVAKLRRIGCPDETIARILADAPAIPEAPAAAESSAAAVALPGETGAAPTAMIVGLATTTSVPVRPAAAAVARYIEPAVGAGMAAGRRLVTARLAAQTAASVGSIPAAASTASTASVSAASVPSSLAAAAATAPTDPSGSEAPPIVAPAGNVALPVAFQPTSHDARMSEAQRNQVDAVQETFAQNIEGKNQDPYSPDYLKRWKSAQQLSDEQYRASFGQEAFLQHQIASEYANRTSN